MPHRQRRPIGEPGNLVEEDPTPPPKLVIMGGPGCGKGSLSRAIINKFGVVHVSVGDILREHVANETEFGAQVKGYLREGRLVPDELAINIVRDRLHQDDVKERGYILDNFPRTGDQAEAMIDIGIIPDKFIYIDVPELTLLERCLGRMNDPETGDIYHERYAPPPDDPAVQARLVRRDDDADEAVVARRMELFNENVESVLDMFESIKREFDGEQKLELLTQDVCAFIKPDAPLYAKAAARPAVTSAEAIRAAYAARQEEEDGPAPREPAPEGEGEGEGAAEGEADGAAGAEAEAEEAAEAAEPAREWDGWRGVEGAKGDAYRGAVVDSILTDCLGARFDARRDALRVERMTWRLTAEHAIKAMDALVSIHTMAFDAGGSAAGAAWAPGDEPAGAPMDSWGRGAVPLKKRAKPLSEELLAQGSKEMRSRPGSSSSRGSRASRASRVSRGYGTGAPPPGAAKKKAPKPPPEEVKARTPTAAEMEEERLRAVLKAKQDAAAAKARRAREYKAEVEKLEKLTKGMAHRGQQFTMDDAGNMIMVNPVAGDKLPAPLVGTRAAMGPSPAPPPDPAFSSKPGGDTKAMAAGLTYFHPSDTVQPPAVESHRLVEGVTLVEGSQTRAGPARERDALHMTRREYTALLET
jgi:adenylate kinase